jgi:hypothetical protein
MAKKKFDPKAKAKRQKIIAAVGGVLLIGLLAFQIPRTLKMLHGSDSAAAQTSASSTTPSASQSSSSLAPPSLAGNPTGTSSGSTGTSSGLQNTGATPGASPGQLVSFSRFPSKDPFVQQVNAACAGSADAGSQCASTSSAPSSAPTSSVPTSSPTSSAVPAVVKPVPSTPSAAKGKAAVLTTATISVNGVASVVKVGASFPAAQPLFRLMSLTATTAKISVVGGSLESGAAAVTLQKGKQLTLMNTADGSRYALKLLATAA